MSVICIVVLLGGIAVSWSTTPKSAFLTSPSILPQASPTPGTVSKEYIYAEGKLIAIKQTLEGDVVSTPEGDGILKVSDWIKVGRFAAGLDLPAAGNEFQRADCAPRSSRGNGVISVSDWVQSGRYAAGLDPPTVAWGPLQASLESDLTAKTGTFFAFAFPSSHLNRFLLGGPITRTVRVVSPSFVAGQNGTVIIELDSQGNENGVGLSLNFNTAQLTFVSAVKGTHATSGTLNVNSSGASSGRVGIALTLPSGQTFSSGTRQIVVATFSAVVGGSHVVSTGDQPIWREVADANANPLTATFTP
jgi:hypothetical protein